MGILREMEALNLIKVKSQQMQQTCAAGGRCGDGGGGGARGYELCVYILCESVNTRHEYIHTSAFIFHFFNPILFWLGVSAGIRAP